MGQTQKCSPPTIQNDWIVLENCNGFEQLLACRALLQARNAKTAGGQSATQVYAYWQYLRRSA